MACEEPDCSFIRFLGGVAVQGADVDVVAAHQRHVRDQVMAAAPPPSLPASSSPVSRGCMDDIQKADRAARLAGSNVRLDGPEMRAAEKALARARSLDLPAAEIKALAERVSLLHRKIVKATTERARSSASSELGVWRVENLTSSQHMTYAELSPSTEYHFNRQVYVTDRNGLPARASAELKITPQSDRLRHAQGTQIGKAGNSSDIGFHLIGAQFGGFGSGPNIVPGNMALNRQGELKFGSMESTWKALLQGGARVHVEISLEESADHSARPAGLLVRFRVEATDSMNFSDPNWLRYIGGQHELFFDNAAPF